MIPASGSPAFLDCIPNTPIGACPGWEYQGQEIDDLRGSAIFLYTDGLTEAENLSHEAFGDAKLLAELRKDASGPAEAVVSRMLRAVAGHVGFAEPSDDLTILCLRLKA
jgi:sigma-B regulation protein RsbU (phosphoserine phosphatase)